MLVEGTILWLKERSYGPVMVLRLMASQRKMIVISYSCKLLTKCFLVNSFILHSSPQARDYCAVPFLIIEEAEDGPLLTTGDLGFEPQPFLTHTSAPKHFLWMEFTSVGLNLQGTLHPLMQTMEQNAHWLPEGLIAPLVLQSLIPGSSLIDKAYSSHGKLNRAIICKGKYPEVWACLLGWLAAAVMSGKQRALMSFCCCSLSRLVTSPWPQVQEDQELPLKSAPWIQLQQVCP